MKLTKEYQILIRAIIYTICNYEKARAIGPGSYMYQYN